MEFSAIALSGNDVPKSLKKAAAGSTDATEPADAADAKNAPKIQVYIGQADSLLIMGNSTKAIEKVLCPHGGRDGEILE